MHSLKQLEKQQIGLRLPKYLVEEIDEFTKEFSLNRTDIIIEAIKSYVNEQKANMFYDDFDHSCKELSTIIKDKKSENLQTLDGLIDELENN
jgi:metal-responsive CopG/Arc/MetJ family transcriptional regulator